MVNIGVVNCMSVAHMVVQTKLDRTIPSQSDTDYDLGFTKLLPYCLPSSGEPPFQTKFRPPSATHIPCSTTTNFTSSEECTIPCRCHPETGKTFSLSILI